MNRRRPLDSLGAWLLVLLGGLLLLTGVTSLVETLVHGDWTESLFTAALLLLIGFGFARGVSQIRRGRSAGRGPGPDADSGSDAGEP